MQFEKRTGYPFQPQYLRARTARANPFAANLLAAASASDEVNHVGSFGRAGGSLDTVSQSSEDDGGKSSSQLHDW